MTQSSSLEKGKETCWLTTLQIRRTEEGRVDRAVVVAGKRQAGGHISEVAAKIRQ